MGLRTLEFDADKGFALNGNWMKVKGVCLHHDAWDIWNYDEGQNIRVVCYTNAPQARLLLNGKVVGGMKPYDEKTGIIYWDIPFQAGELRAEGCDEEGNALSGYSIRTSGRPYAIRATADRTILSGDRATAHITVEWLTKKVLL